MTALNPAHDPIVAVFWEQESFSPLEIAEAASGLCRPLWVINSESGTPRFPIRFLERLGDVVDIAGMGDESVATSLAAHDIAGVVAFHDGPQVQMASVANRLGLPFHRPSTAERLRDKYKQRTALRAAGIPVPQFVALEGGVLPADALKELTLFPFPAVLKPRKGSGSRDTFWVKSEAECRSILQLCPSEQFVLEEYIDDSSVAVSQVGADIVSVETVAEQHGYQHVALTGRFAFAPPFRETGSFLPSDLSPRDVGMAQDLTSAALRALDVSHGVLHTEIKFSSSGPRIIEVNGRVGGGIPGLLTRVGGPPILRWALRLALSLEVEKITPVPPSPIAFFRWLLAPVGATTLIDVRGLTEAAALPGLQQAHLNRDIGERVDAREGSTFGHVVALEGIAPDHDALKKLMADIDSLVELTFDSMAETSS